MCKRLVSVGNRCLEEVTLFIKRKSGQSAVETLLIVSVISIAILYFFNFYLFDDKNSPVWTGARDLAQDQASGLTDAGAQ